MAAGCLGVTFWRKAKTQARESMNRIIHSFVLAALTTSVSTGSGVAQSFDTAEASDDDWRFTVQPYLFLPVRTQGTSTVAGTSVDLDLDLGEVLDILQGALSLRGEAWRGDFGIIADGYYVYLEDGYGVSGPMGGGFDLTSETRQGWVSLQGAYRLADGVIDATGRRFVLDASAGVRFNWLNQEIDVDVTAPGPGLISRSFGGTESWAEPMVGLRGAVEIADRWTLGARVELGGFGVEGNDLQYTAVAGVDWRAWDNTSILFGYQFYGIDYSTNRSDGEFAYDIDQHGLYTGVAFRF